MHLSITMGHLLDILAIPSNVDVDRSGFPHNAYACSADEDALLCVSYLFTIFSQITYLAFATSKPGIDNFLVSITGTSQRPNDASANLTNPKESQE
jgi:hypothetical protein